jgi:hypothetical protein
LETGEVKELVLTELIAKYEFKMEDLEQTRKG